MPKKLTYAKLQKKVKKIETDLRKYRLLESSFQDLRVRFNELSLELDRRGREVNTLKNIISMPELIVDANWKILSYSRSFLSFVPHIVNLTPGESNLADLIEEEDFRKIENFWHSAKMLKNSPFRTGNKWVLRYRGPGVDDAVGKSFSVSPGCSGHRWKIRFQEDRYKIVHLPHTKSLNDCILISNEGYGSSVEDLKVQFKFKTSVVPGFIRDISLLISCAAPGKLPCEFAYGVCSGSAGNNLSRIQRMRSDLFSVAEQLEPSTEYEIVTERIGGKISRTLEDLDRGHKLETIEAIDSDACYDIGNHIAFHTFSGELEVYDLEISTRASKFNLDQFRLTKPSQVRLRPEILKDGIFNIKFGQTTFRHQKALCFYFDRFKFPDSAEM